jgi:catechol 2,3-dioxygenase-like lactoylglutathione lyase family enzyme
MEKPGDFLLDHVQITVPPDTEKSCLHFYGTVLGLEEIPKPENLRKRGGAWYRAGSVELHVSVEDLPSAQNEASRRHVCFCTPDLEAAERRLRDAGVAILVDNQPTPGWLRFYVRDPGGCRIEIAQRVPPVSAPDR